VRLIFTMSQMTNSPVILIITPTHVRANEMKMQLKTTEIQDRVATRINQRTTFVLLAVEMDKTDYWLKKTDQKKKSSPLIELDTVEEAPLDDPSQSSHYPPVGQRDR
jgi:hypothetical protein